VTTLQIKVGGRWLSSQGPWGDLNWSTCLQGSDELSWVMPSTRQPTLRGRRRRRTRDRLRRPTVELYDGLFPIWRGTLGEPDHATGAFHAVGSWQLAYNYIALAGDGSRTSVPNTAIDAAITRGLPWTRSVNIAGSVISSDVLDEAPTVGALLDAWAAKANKHWAVNPAGEVYSYSTPSAADWHITPGQSLGESDDDYASSLIGVRRAAAGGFARSTVTDTATAARWGPKEAWVDLRELGYLTDAEAIEILTGMLEKARKRPSYTSSIVVTREQLLTRGGIPARLPSVHAGQKMQLHGLWDDTRELHGRPTLGVLIGRTVHDPAAGTVELQPAAMRPRNFTDVLAYRPNELGTSVAVALPV
jgi:hypothetical protein